MAGNNNKSRFWKIFLGYIVPLSLFIFFIIWHENDQRIISLRDDTAELKLETSGLITSISKAGKGSYEIIICCTNGEADTLGFSGLGDHPADILVNDSIVKKKGHCSYLIYQKTDTGYCLKFTKEARCAFPGF